MPTPTVINLNNLLPVAPSGKQLVLWQADSNNPRNVSAYPQSASTSLEGTIILAQDLAGTADLPEVVGIQGIPIVGSPVGGDVLEYVYSGNTLQWVSGGGGGGGVQIGTIASLPAVGVVGSTYFCTDAPYTFVSTGSLWQAYFQGYPVNQPIYSNFAWVAQGTASYDQSHGTLIINRPTTAGDQLSSLVVTPPSTPYTYTMGFRPFLERDNFTQVGFIARNSSTGKCFALSWYADGSNDRQLQGVRYTQPSTGLATFDATAYQSTNLPDRDPIFLQLNNDGTHLNCRIGLNPWYFIGNAYVEPLSTWVSSVDQIGFFADCNYSPVGGANVLIDCFHWVQS